MKPTIFEKNETIFTSLGIARLPDAISCTVTEELNGAFELEMIYPVSGRFFEEIAEDRIIAVPPSDGASKQAFRIYRISTPMNGQVVVSARHISYQLNFIPVQVLSGTGTAQDMLDDLKSAALETCPFTLTSNISSSNSYGISMPVSMRAALGGAEGSALDTFGGEFEWDNWNVKLLTKRGADNGVRITYGKNLTDITRTVDIGETITGLMAYYNDGADIIYTTPRIISNANVGNYAHPRTVVVDVTSSFSEKPSSADLTTYVTSLLASTPAAKASDAVSVNFVALWQSPGYEQYAPLERVNLGDTVYVSYKQLGISVKKRVTKTVYNVILNRYDTIELDSETSVADTIAGLSESGSGIENAVSGISNKTRDMAFILKETGTFSIPAKSSVTATDISVVFSETYSEAPRILVVGNNASAMVYGLPCLTANTTTGATIRLRNSAAHGSAASFRWFTVASA